LALLGDLAKKCEAGEAGEEAGEEGKRWNFISVIVVPTNYDAGHRHTGTRTQDRTRQMCQ